METLSGISGKARTGEAAPEAALHSSDADAGSSLIPAHLPITYGCCTSSTRIILGSLAIGDGGALAAEES